MKATLLMALYSVRSERLFCEQLDYNLLFRCLLRPKEDDDDDSYRRDSDGTRGSDKNPWMNRCGFP